MADASSSDQSSTSSHAADVLCANGRGVICTWLTGWDECLVQARAAARTGKRPIALRIVRQDYPGDPIRREILGLRGRMMTAHPGSTCVRCPLTVLPHDRLLQNRSVGQPISTGCSWPKAGLHGWRLCPH